MNTCLELLVHLFRSSPRLGNRVKSGVPSWPLAAPQAGYRTAVFISKYPPTPAFAKAGAAPGTTAGVEPCTMTLMMLMHFMFEMLLL